MALRILLLEITQKCNAHCDQCGSRCDMNSEENLKKEEILSLFQDVRENIGTDVMLNITGGEPLLRKDLFEIMTEASEMGFDWGMVTNGTLITDAVIQKMKESGMKTITISIDGMRYTHENLRHLPGSYDRIMTAIKKLQKADFLDHLQVTFTSNRRNVYEFPALYRELNRLQIDSVRTSCIDMIGRAQDFQELSLQKPDFLFLFDFINEVNRNPKNVPIVWGCCHFLSDRIKGRTFECFTGKESASVLYNGDIFACPNIPRKDYLIQGNIRTDRFSDVWNTKFTWFRTRTLPAYCKGCKYEERCKGDSVHSWDFDRDCPKFCYRDLFEPETKAYMAELSERFPVLHKTCIEGPDEDTRIYLEPAAYEKMRRYFHMGMYHKTQKYEQQMSLIGFRLNDDYVIKDVIPTDIHPVNAKISMFNRAIYEKSLDACKKAIQKFQASERRSEYGTGKLRFLGYAHSHPAQKALQYSTGDERIHKALMKRHGDYIGILLNPAEDTIGACFSNRKNQIIRQGNLFLLETPDSVSFVPLTPEP